MKVAILGFSGSRRLAPFDDYSWEIWGCNNLYQHIPRWDRWFELHKREVNMDDEGPEHIRELAKLTCLVYMQRHFEDIPTSAAYPLEKVVKKFRPYLTSTFSFMVALAILEGAKEIGVYGVDTADEEWGSQRPSLEYFLGYAEGVGIKITIPKESTLLRAPFVYAYQERHEQEFFGKLLNFERDYQRHVDKNRDVVQRETLAIARSEGALEVLRQLRREWARPFQSETFDAEEEK